MKIGFITYGCKVNRYETERIKQALLGGGNTESTEPDVYVINTCTVTGTIDREIARKIRQIKHNNKKVLLTGCLAERGDRAGFEGLADWIVPNSGKCSVEAYPPEITAGAPAASPGEVLKSFSNINKAFIKIEDGCNRFCSYCEIPFVRGSAVRSRDSKEILEEISALSRAGYEEIVLTGINLGLFGAEKNEPAALLGLLEKIKKLGLPLRVRLSSIGPRDISAGIIAFAAENPGFLCPHFHMSAQSGSDDVLKMMGRPYTAEYYTDKARAVVSAVPRAAVTTDIITGFPGETEKMHMETVEFIKKTSLSRIHVFTYSDRPDTKASKFLDKMDDGKKKKRFAELTALAAEKESEFLFDNIDRDLTMLVEYEDARGLYPGYTENYIKVYVRDGGAFVNRLVPVRIKEIKDGVAMAEMMTETAGGKK